MDKIRAPGLAAAAPVVGCLAMWPSSCSLLSPCGDIGFVDLRIVSTEVPGTCVVAWLAFSLTVGEKETLSRPRVGKLPCPASCFAEPAAEAVVRFGTIVSSEISVISDISDLVRSTGLPTHAPGTRAR
eukprot:SAG11_NODE_159_length_14027_cov_6.893667_3_plen_128_part_00